MFVIMWDQYHKKPSEPRRMNSTSKASLSSTPEKRPMIPSTQVPSHDGPDNSGNLYSYANQQLHARKPRSRSNSFEISRVTASQR
eukprot:787837-Pyramimonas_sp.AAC.1